jgi:hypothetical protein
MEEDESLFLFAFYITVEPITLFRHSNEVSESSVYSSTHCPSKSSGARTSCKVLGSMSWTLLPVPLQCFISRLIHGISARFIASMPNINTVRLNAIRTCRPLWIMWIANTSLQSYFLPRDECCSLTLGKTVLCTGRGNKEYRAWLALGKYQVQIQGRDYYTEICEFPQSFFTVTVFENNTQTFLTHPIFIVYYNSLTLHNFSRQLS